MHCLISAVEGVGAAPPLHRLRRSPSPFHGEDLCYTSPFSQSSRFVRPSPSRSFAPSLPSVGSNPFARYPRIIGHEFAGEVVDLGREVQLASLCRGPELRNAGLEFGDMGIFHRLVLGKKVDGPVFSMANMVKPGTFNPPPKVNSGVIRLSRNKMNELPCDEKLFWRTVKAGFNQRRKTLRNALSGVIPKDKMDTHPFFDQRAEQLSVDEFISLTQHLSSLMLS